MTDLQKTETSARPLAKSEGKGRAKILAVSTKLFAQYGFEGVAMRQISKAAGLTLPSIYHHFGNKEDLYKAVEAAMYTAHAESLRKALISSDSPEENLRNFVSTLLNHLDSSPDYLKLLQRGLIEDWEENQQFLVETSMQGVFDELKRLLDNYKTGGGDGPYPIMIFSLIIGFLTMQPVTNKLDNYSFSRLSNREQHAQITTAIIDFIMDKK